MEQLQITVLKQRRDLSKTFKTFFKENYHCCRPNVFSRLLWIYCNIVCLRTFDTRYVDFNRISNWSNCKSLFWNYHVTLVKLLGFSKDIFRAIIQIYFQVSSDLFIVFAPYDRRYLCFMEYWTEVMTVVVWIGHVMLCNFLLVLCEHCSKSKLSDFRDLWCT